MICSPENLRHFRTLGVHTQSLPYLNYFLAEPVVAPDKIGKFTALLRKKLATARPN